MVEKLQITIDVIIHATENIQSFLQSFEEVFELEEEDFSIQYTQGHFSNPITIIHAELIKDKAVKFIEKLFENLTIIQRETMIRDIEKRVTNSKYHLRLDKQEFVNKKIIFNEKDAIKLKIYTPIYNKQDKIRKFKEVFMFQLD